MISRWPFQYLWCIPGSFLGNEGVAIIGGCTRDVSASNSCYILNVHEWKLRKVWTIPAQGRRWLAVWMIYVSDILLFYDTIPLHGLNVLSLLSPDSDSALIQKPLISLQLPITLPEGRHSHCAVKYGRGVIIIGGLNPAMMPISSCLQLSWYTGDWHLDEIMFEPPLPPRCVYDTGWACVRAQVLQEICIPSKRASSDCTGTA